MFIKLYIKKDLIYKISFTFLSLILTGTLCIFAFSNIPKEKHQEEVSLELPILMYHGLVKNTKKQNKFMIDPNLFENDLKYLKEHNITTIFLKDLIDYVEGNCDLPKKCIMITFDDGYYNNYLYAYNLAKEYNSKIIISPIGKCLDEYSKIDDKNEFYSYLTWSQLDEMVKSGLVEVQNHSYDMHSKGKNYIGCKKKKNESLEQYKERFKNDIQKQQDLITKYTNTTPLAFVYPFGAFSDETPDILKEMGFKATFFCYNKINNITKNPECLNGLCRFIRPNNISTNDFFTKIYKN